MAYYSYSEVFMEKLLEIFLMICLDAIKGLVIQCIIDWAKNCWASIKNSNALRYA